MRCPICDYNMEDPQLSLFYSGVVSPRHKDLWVDTETGVISCSCFEDPENTYEDDGEDTE